MSSLFLLSLVALASMVPAALMPARSRAEGGGRLYWALVCVAILGPGLLIYVAQGQTWRTGIAAALWLAIGVTVALFAIVALASDALRRLTPLLLGYLIALGILAVLWQHEPERPLSGAAPAGWLQAHIFVAIVAYGLLTLAAVAGLGVVLQERALKLKRPTAFTRQLPPVAQGEALQGRLLLGSAVLLGIALVTGAWLTWRETGLVLRPDHKTVLSLATFAVLVVLVALHAQKGLSGRRAARYILLAYLLLTLAYLGVKFVTDVVLA